VAKDKVEKAKKLAKGSKGEEALSPADGAPAEGEEGGAETKTEAAVESAE
jgi:hypothetical protein